MAKDLLVNKKDNKFIKKSNVIVRAVTNEGAGIMTQRLFNFAILSIKKDEKSFIGNIRFWLKDFCDYFNIKSYTLYDTVIHKKKEMTIIEKEIDNITSLKFWLQDDKNGNFKFVNLFLEGGLNNGYIELKVNKDLTTKYYLDLKKDYTNVYLPYTKTVTSKYSLRLYEYLRSYLYMNAKTKKTPIFKHEWNFEKLAKILNLSLNSSYFKNIGDLKRYVLEPVKKDLEKTDIIFTYELQKVGRKYGKIILNTHLDLEKFNAQNPELEKLPIKNEYKLCKEYISKPKLTIKNFKKQKSKIIDEPILSDEQVKKIMQDLDNH